MSEAEFGPLPPLRRADRAVVDDDPFWGAVRRRHPDVDLVLLGPESDPPAAPPDPEEARRQVAAVTTAWDLVAPLVRRAAPKTPPPAARWRRHGAGHRFEVQVALVDVGAERGTALLRGMLVALGEHGWGLAPTTRRDLAVLVASDGVVRLRAEAGAGATVLTLRGRAVRIDAADRDAALSEAWGEQSWQ